eukprot:SAG31_NODE_50_length_30520_cov_89.906712_17_plen_254_part_00
MFFTAALDTKDDCGRHQLQQQETDTHWRARGDGEFNFRMKYDIQLPLFESPESYSGQWERANFSIKGWDKDPLTFGTHRFLIVLHGRCVQQDQQRFALALWATCQCAHPCVCSTGKDLIGQAETLPVHSMIMQAWKHYQEYLQWREAQLKRSDRSNTSADTMNPDQQLASGVRDESFHVEDAARKNHTIIRLRKLGTCNHPPFSLETKSRTRDETKAARIWVPLTNPSPQKGHREFWSIRCIALSHFTNFVTR